MNIKAKYKNFFNKIYPYIAVTVFCIATLIIAFLRVPFWDEAHQIDIARLSVIEIFKITKVVGHPALWYLIIKPFSNPALYPYPVMILNWIFCVLSIIILWKKSPFNLVTKTLITFSAPFLFYFAPVARCYSLGILFLFLLCVYYPVKSRHPYIFAFLIAICSNTSAMAMVGCFYIGLLFLYELYKKKNKELKYVVLIFTLCAILIILQYIGVEKPYDLRINDIFSRIFFFVVIPLGLTTKHFLLHLFSSAMFYIMPLHCFRRSKSALFFFAGVYLSLTYIFIAQYSGNYWNHYFYYIYLIVGFWIFYRKIYKPLPVKILFNLIVVMLCFRESIFIDTFDLAYNSNSKQIAQIILNNYKNDKIYSIDGWSDLSPGADIFLMRNNVFIYDRYNRNKTGYESLSKIYLTNFEKINFDNIFENMDKDSLLASCKELMGYSYKDTFIYRNKNDYIIKTKNNSYYLKNIEHKDKIDFYLYKPIKTSSYDKINL